MLGPATPTSTTTTLQAATSSATPTSPTRPSRLRGLSYLRNYTHDRFGSSRSESPALTRSTSSPNTSSFADNQAAERDGTTGGLAASSAIQNGGGGWLPTVQGRSGLSRECTDLTSTSTDPASPEPSGIAASMSRSRAATVLGPTPTSSAMDGSSSANNATAASSSGTQAKELHPTIRFIPHVETRSSRPSLNFTAVSKTLKGPNTIVRVGRYSDREQAVHDESVLPVGFKSKVVSRRHCEFWCTNGQWYVKDVKSSSGTFLNHVRLSSPGVESRPYPVNDGDVIQLGIDFKGGEEVIFRCVKIRVECNRGWQKSLNNYNTTTHKKLLKSVAGKSKRESDAASVSNHECSICLNPVTPCQCLFVAPCSHVWHYKCVRNLVHGPNWPNFLCPNCRFVADLEADVEPPEEEELYEEDAVSLQGNDENEVDEQLDSANPGPSGSSDEAAGGAASSSSENEDHDREAQPSTTASLPQANGTESSSSITDDELVGLIQQTTLAASSHPEYTSTVTPPTTEPTTSSTTQPVPIASASATKRRLSSSDLLNARSATPTSNTQFALAAGVMADGPLTPRNDAGPFVLDGAAGRTGSAQHDQGLDGVIQRAVEDERQ